MNVNGWSGRQSYTICLIVTTSPGVRQQGLSDIRGRKKHNHHGRQYFATLAPGAGFAQNGGVMKKAELVLALVAAAGAMAQTPGGRKGAPAPGGAAPSGAALYRNYCESCHGADGKGGGPKAEQLAMKMPDLTRLAEKANGEFPALRLRRLLGEDGISGSHGTKRMPVWGSALDAGKPGSAESQERIDRVVDHLRSLQAKPRSR